MTMRASSVKERTSLGQDNDPLLGPLGGGDSSSDQATNASPRQVSYFDLSKRTAAAVERAQTIKATQGRDKRILTPSFSPGERAASLREDDADSNAPPSRQSTLFDSAPTSVGRSTGEAGDNSLGNRETTLPASRNAKTVSMVMLDGGVEESEEQNDGQPPTELLQAFHQMPDVDLDRHTKGQMASATILLRATSRALADSRQEIEALRNELQRELDAAKSSLHQAQDTAAKREQALISLCRGYGGGDGEIERALTRVSKQQTVAQKIAGQQKLLGESLQEAMDDSLGDVRADAEVDVVKSPEKAEPVFIDATLRAKDALTARALAAGKTPPSAEVDSSYKSTNSSISSGQKRTRRPRSDSIASSSAPSIAGTSRKTEGTGGLSDWASSLVPWGSGSKKAPPSVSSGGQEDVTGELSVGEISTDDEDSRSTRSRRASVASSRKREPSVASQSSIARAVPAGNRTRNPSRSLSIFGGLSWKRSAKEKTEDSTSVRGDPVTDDESADESVDGDSMESPALRGVRAARRRIPHDQDLSRGDTVRIKATPHASQIQMPGDSEGDESLNRSGTVRSGKTPGRTTAADVLRMAGSSGDATPVKSSGRNVSNGSSTIGRVPNVTTVPQIYGNAADNPQLPLTPAPVKTMELKAMVPKDARPPTLAAVRLENGEINDTYEEGSDPFEVYGGAQRPPAGEAALPAKPTDTTLTDRYGFMYAATPADLRLLRQAKEASIPAPACLAGTRVEAAVDSEEDAASSHGSEISLSSRPSISRTSSFLVGHAEKAKASTQASSISVSTHALEDEMVERKATVKALLKQLDDLCDEKQAEQRIKWENYLKERQGKMQTMRRRTKANFDEEDEASINSLDTNLNLVGIAQMGTSKTGREDWRQFLKLCLGGIPLAYRSQIWAECSGANEIADPGRYDELLGEHDGEENQCLAQIDLDVHRTMPTNVFFGGDGPGVPKLRRVLAAFSWYDVEIGYCQAMNNIAATLLLIDPSEEKTFWLLVCLIEKIMPRDYYTSHLLTSQADQRVLIEYTQEILPKLWKHLQDELGIDLPAVTFAWFLSLYTDCLPVEALFRVWDLLFVEGMVTLFRVAIAILQLHEKELLAAESPAAFYGLMHRITGRLFSADKLIQATSALRDRIKQADATRRRKAHIGALKVELGLIDSDQSPSVA